MCWYCPVPAFPAHQAAWQDADSLLQIPGVGPKQASRIRAKGVSSFRDLVLRGEASARKLLEGSGLSTSGGDGRAGRPQGQGSVAHVVVVGVMGNGWGAPAVTIDSTEGYVLAWRNLGVHIMLGTLVSLC